MNNRNIKNKLIAIVCIVTGIILIVAGYFFLSSNDNKFFTNDDYNINNNGGNVAVKIDDYYYVMGKNFFVKVDEDNNIVIDIGKENNVSEFTIEPFMQVYDDYIYYAVGGYFKQIYRYNYKTNIIELYSGPKEIFEDSALVSTYFIRNDKLFYQPYSKDYYYAINLKNNTYEKLQPLDFSAYGIIMNFESNMYKNNIIYEKSNNLNYLDVLTNEIKTVINHECEYALVYDNQIYYLYNKAVYKSNLDGTNETLVYDGKFSKLKAVYGNYLYVSVVSSGRKSKIIDINTGKEINELVDCIDYSIAVDKLICTDYQNNTAYSYDLDGNNKKLIYDGSKKSENESENDKIDNSVNNDQTIGDTDDKVNNESDNNIDEVVSDNIQFTADVYFLTKAEGGRHTPFFSDSVFQYQFGNSSMYDGKIRFPSGVSMVSPGDNVVLTITLAADENISVGTKFTVYQNSERIIGNGLVKEIIK